MFFVCFTTFCMLSRKCCFSIVVIFDLYPLETALNVSLSAEASFTLPYSATLLCLLCPTLSSYSVRLCPKLLCDAILPTLSHSVTLLCPTLPYSVVLLCPTLSYSTILLCDSHGNWQNLKSGLTDTD